MCLGVPMRVVAVSSVSTVRAEIMGLSRFVRVDLLPETRPGDYILVHAGFALQKIDAGEAENRLAMLRESLRDTCDADYDHKR